MGGGPFIRGGKGGGIWSNQVETMSCLKKSPINWSQGKNGGNLKVYYGKKNRETLQCQTKTEIQSRRPITI